MIAGSPAAYLSGPEFLVKNIRALVNEREDDDTEIMILVQDFEFPQSPWVNLDSDSELRFHIGCKYRIKRV